VGDTTTKDELDELVKLARQEVVRAAERVKTKDGSSLHPIVEGTASILESIALDQQKILTVSVLDPHTEDHLYYSVPCRVGVNGVKWRCTKYDSEVKSLIANCCDGLRKVLSDAGEK
jgi:malate/lactate dehydrogenase